MPAQEQAFLPHKAVLWAWFSTDQFGQPVVSSTPVEIDVRWTTKRTTAYAPDGSPVTLDATAVVDRFVAIGSEMWLGELASWYGTGSAGDDSEVCVVRTYSETADLKGREVTYTVGLMKRRG